MLVKSHRKVTKEAFSILRVVGGENSLLKHRDTVVEEAGSVDDYRDLEFIDVESWAGPITGGSGRDDPHRSSAGDDDDVARYTYEGHVYTAFNHFIDIKKGRGTYDDYDGYSYRRGSASDGEYQDADDAKKDWKIKLLTHLTGHRKVDDALNYWFNDEYVHAPGQSWYRGCSPAVERYAFPTENGSIEDELRARFPLADYKGKSGKGIPYSVFMPVDNMAWYWYNLFINTQYPPALGPVMHAIQDASVPHHAAGYNGNWHSRYENDLHSCLNEWFRDECFVEGIKRLYKGWKDADGALPNRLSRSDWGKVPNIGSRSDTLVTWVALNAYKAYAGTYNHFRNGYRFDAGSAKELTQIATAMSMLFLSKATHDRFAKLALALGDRDEFWGIKCQVQSFRQHGHYIRHRNWQGEVTEIKTDLDRADATLRIVPGLADADCISFESVNYPGHYLRHQNYRIVLSPYGDEQLLKEDATFRLRPGLGNKLWSSFESYNYPGYYIRQKGTHLYIDNIAQALAIKDWASTGDANFLILWTADNIWG